MYAGRHKACPYRRLGGGTEGMSRMGAGGCTRAGTRPAPTGDLGRDGRYCMLLLRGHLWPAQGGADSGDEFGGGEGFDYVVYGA